MGLRSLEAGDLLTIVEPDEGGHRTNPKSLDKVVGIGIDLKVDHRNSHGGGGMFDVGAEYPARAAPRGPGLDDHDPGVRRPPGSRGR